MCGGFSPHSASSIYIYIYGSTIIFFVAGWPRLPNRVQSSQRLPMQGISPACPHAMTSLPQGTLTQDATSYTLRRLTLRRLLWCPSNCNITADAHSRTHQSSHTTVVSLAIYPYAGALGVESSKSVCFLDVLDEKGRVTTQFHGSRDASKRTLPFKSTANIQDVAT